ncbi:MAG: P1 family peptidase [Ilumatobacter sp.]
MREVSERAVPGSEAPFGSITDVSGIGVGHHHRSNQRWKTGTTVVTAAHGATPGVDVRGGGPGTRETDALRPENLINTIHAITLTGGSAFGLAAADGVMSVMEERGLGFPIAGGIVPVVPAAVIFDLGRGGEFANRPDAEFGARAARAALSLRSSRWGAVGAGTGARAGGLQGGVGTASILIDLGGQPLHVGALAVVNSNGSVVDPATALPWEQGELSMHRPSLAERQAVQRAASGTQVSLNTTIGVVATSARLSKAEASKVATVAHDGLARAIRPAHSMTDGDSIFSMATGTTALADDPAVRIPSINAILRAAADAFALACTHALLSAATVGNAPAWRDLCPNSLA